MSSREMHDLSNLNHYEFGINATGVGVAGGVRGRWGLQEVRGRVEGAGGVMERWGNAGGVREGQGVQAV